MNSWGLLSVPGNYKRSEYTKVTSLKIILYHFLIFCNFLFLSILIKFSGSTWLLFYINIVHVVYMMVFTQLRCCGCVGISMDVLTVSRAMWENKTFLNVFITFILNFLSDLLLVLPLNNCYMFFFVSFTSKIFKWLYIAALERQKKIFVIRLQMCAFEIDSYIDQQLWKLS